ncbi:all-trans retinoic acid-induced differentiation factor isoform X1 [Strix aluco]|uniref:all-trans retinoic acid-induced differentiation factor isoform X1 n=1 Tax=Strix aluco TaxID=111821 RepID=UPI003DA3D7C1
MGPFVPVPPAPRGCGCPGDTGHSPSCLQGGGGEGGAPRDWKMGNITPISKKRGGPGSGQTPRELRGGVGMAGRWGGMAKGEPRATRWPATVGPCWGVRGEQPVSPASASVRSGSQAMSSSLTSSLTSVWRTEHWAGEERAGRPCPKSHRRRTARWPKGDRDLTENPLTLLPNGSFLGFTRLQRLAVPLVLECPGGSGAWDEVTTLGSSRLCQGQRNPCNGSGELAWPCPENAACAPAGPGLIQCLCNSPFHGYKCLRQGMFPVLLFCGILGAVTLSLSLLLWGTQRRKAKTP